MGTPPLSRRGLMRGAVLLGVGAAAGGLELLTAPGAAAAPNPGIASTAAWGARAPRGLSVIGSNPNKVIVHHTATANSTNYSRAHAYALARSIQNFHMDTRRWADTGQHFTISRGGYAMEGRHHSLPRLNAGSGMVVGAHASGQNSQAIGIENEGIYTSVGPTTALYNKLVAMCAYICDQYGIASSQIYGHRDFAATQCPGNVLYSMLPQLRNDVAAARGGGRGKTTVGWYRYSDASFHLRDAHSGGDSNHAFVYGPANADIVPITGDWDGNGRTTVGWYRSSDASFHLRNSLSGGDSHHAFVFGPANSGDVVPITGDWNGDGRTTVGWYRYSDSSFHLRDDHGGGDSHYAFVYGPANADIVPITGDWNGDGRTTVGWYRPSDSSFHLRNSLSGGDSHHAFVFGPANAGIVPITGDWNGDGRTTAGWYRYSDSSFHLRDDHGGGDSHYAFVYGPANADIVPITGDWNGA